MSALRLTFSISNVLFKLTTMIVSVSDRKGGLTLLNTRANSSTISHLNEFLNLLLEPPPHENVILELQIFAKANLELWLNGKAILIAFKNSWPLERSSVQKPSLQHCILLFAGCLARNT